MLLGQHVTADFYRDQYQLILSCQLDRHMYINARMSMYFLSLLEWEEVILLRFSSISCSGGCSHVTSEIVCCYFHSLPLASSYLINRKRHCIDLWKSKIPIAVQTVRDGNCI